MLPNLLSHPFFLISGAITGFILGFLIQKGRLSQFSVIIGQLLLKDFTVFKIMLTAIIVGSIGIYGMLSFGLPLMLHIKKMPIVALALGGTIFGTGMAVLGYCPGTCVAAAGQGSRDAWWGILGMITGAGIYALLHPFVKTYIYTAGRLIDSTLPIALGISPWIIIGTLILVLLAFIKLVKK